VVLVLFENLPLGLWTIPLGGFISPWVQENPQRNSAKAHGKVSKIVNIIQFRGPTWDP